MADRKISDLTALTTPASGDFLPIVDVSEAAAASKNKRITIEELMRGVPDGTAAAPGIAFETDPNTGIYSPGADQLAVATNGAGRLFVDASGRLLVGTSSSRQSRLGGSNFQTQLQLESDSTAGLATSRFNDSVGGPFVTLQKGRGTIASPAAVIANDATGTIIFSGWDGAAFTNSALIRSEVDGTPGANDMPGRLVFFTTADGDAGSTERLRIDSAGAIDHNAAGGNLITTLYSGSVTDNGASGVNTFAVTFTFPDSGHYFICEIIGYHPTYTGANEYYRVLATKRGGDNTFEANFLEDLTTTGSTAVTDTTVTITGRRPRSSTGTSTNSLIKVIFRGTVLPTSVTIANS
jgi:hypothetical protein